MIIFCFPFFRLKFAVFTKMSRRPRNHAFNVSGSRKMRKNRLKSVLEIRRKGNALFQDDRRGWLASSDSRRVKGKRRTTNGMLLVTRQREKEREREKGKESRLTNC